MLIRDLLRRNLRETIEEIVKVEQADEQSVYTEITEYVVTSRISDQYRQLLTAIADAPSDPSEGVGVWVSGFFGSGKSSFSKNLGYALSNPKVLGTHAADLFKNQFTDGRIHALVDSINSRIPTEAVMFDVTAHSPVRGPGRLTEILYSMLLAQLGYAEDFDIAELEIELEAEGKLPQFESLCPQIHDGLTWHMARKSAQKLSRASAILHAMDPATYPSADSWARAIGARTADITVAKFVGRAFELTDRRRKGKALFFIVDEVGQYVARSAEKIEDLRAIVEQFGKESKNRIKAKKAIAPVWIVVTSQEKLEEVVAAIDSRRVELAKLQDRFKYHIDLAPADIREVATRRVLGKKDDALPVLNKLFSDHQGQLNASCQLERTSRHSEVRQDDFVQFYPYLPHYIDLSIDVMSSIRLQPGAPKHQGGSNRTIIKQAYEMLVNERTSLADKPAGTLVTLDKIYELVEGNLSSERQKDISDIHQRFANDPDDHGWALRVARAVCLLEFVRDLPRTAPNIAALLVDTVSSPRPLQQVEAALQRLQAAQFIRETEEGYKLQTAQEKNWDTERRGYLEPRPKDRNDIKREILGEIFSDPRIKSYRFADLRTFRLGLSVDGVRIGEEGDLTLSVLVADDVADLPSRLLAAQDDSRQPSHQNDLYWVMALTPDIDDLIANLYASRQMVTKYEQLRAQNRINHDEAALLSAEKQEALRIQSRLKDKLSAALQPGTSLFRGVSRDGSSLGKTTTEAIKKFLDETVPELYPKLPMGVRSLKGTEAEDLLKAANLNGLPQLFYEGDQGLGLVTREGLNKYIPNPSAPIAKEILDYLKREQSYGNKVTGKTLEEHFGGIGYGWERDMLRLVLAVLLRAGAVEVTHQGHRFRGHQDPLARFPFTNNPAFRAASFAPRETIDLKTLTTAVEHYESLSGDEVDVEEAAIAISFKKLADEELKLLLPLDATVRANSLPLREQIEEYRANLETIQNADTDDCVRILAGEGKSLKDSRDRIRQIRNTLTDQGLKSITLARRVLAEMWPALRSRPESTQLEAVAGQLETLLGNPDFYSNLSLLSKLATRIRSAYGDVYTGVHGERYNQYTSAIDGVKGQPEWTFLTPEMQPILLAPLSTRVCEEHPDLHDEAVTCCRCAATIGQMESDLAAVHGLKAQAVDRLIELTTPEQPTVRVKLSSFFTADLSSTDAVDQAIEQLRERLYLLVQDGARIVLE